MYARLSHLCALSLMVLSFTVAPATAQPPDYTLFESGHVRPMAMSPDGAWLYTCNTPDAHVEAYVLGPGGGTHIYTIPVGLEPVAIAAVSNDELWVVNHLSDSVSIVDVSASPPRVVRTLLTGDEPRDIVIASGKAFVTTAHRGQNTAWQDGDFAAPGVGRADVWVYDVASRGGAGMGGTPITVINLFGDRPRALAASPDGTRVYAGVFRSGNQTVPVGEGLVCNGAGPCNVLGTVYPAGLPDPDVNLGRCSNSPSTPCLTNTECPGGSCDGEGTNREAGLIVGYDEGLDQWLDEAGNDWSAAVPFELPDYDVFEIDAAAATPVQIGTLDGGTGIIEGVPHVGTILFNMVVAPNGDVFVSNTDANNRVRFEGLGEYESFGLAKSSGDPASVRGEIAKSRVTVLDASGDLGGTPHTEFAVIPRHLNPHIPYQTIPVPAGVEDLSIATPMEMVLSGDGSTLYVAGFGSNDVHVYDTTQLKNGTFTPNAGDIISIPANSALGITGGASGLVLDESRGRIYVASRTTNQVYMFDTSTKTLVDTLTPHNPEPAEIIEGRPFLYDAKLTGSNGEASCSSCHIFGDMDDQSWDLGDPDARKVANNNPVPGAVNFPPLNVLQDLDALKGPMTTQSLRGMVNMGPMHWRGDRTGPACEAGIDFVRDPTCENEAFNAFNVAFPGLIGRDEGELAAADMQKFTDFALRLTYPPNPIRNLDNSLTPTQLAGSNIYFGANTDIVTNCNGCHTVDRGPGFFGGNGGSTFEGEAMEFKVPHLRNAYQKVGMFGFMPSSFFPDAPGTSTGPQVRGTGFLHDGSVPSVFDFLAAEAFNSTQNGNNALDDGEQDVLEAFILAFDTDLAPIVGQQVTLDHTNLTEVEPRIDLLIAEGGIQFPETGELHCELIVKGVINGEQRSWLRVGPDSFVSDKQTEANWSKQDLLDAAAVVGQPLTFTCAPPGSGFRMALDRDRDLLWDFDDPFPDFFNSGECNIGPSTPARSAGSVLWLVMLGFAARRVAGRRRRA